MNRLSLYIILFLIFLLPHHIYGDEDFIGSERCKICHKEEYEKFSKTAHKDTSKNLDKNDKKNSECLMCHSMYKDGKIMEIGCEACHGSGKYYSQEYVMKDKELSRLIGLKKPDEETCKKCHTGDTPKINKMDIKEGMKKIEHKKIKKGENKNSEK